jgi:hypothetical protein
MARKLFPRRNVGHVIMLGALTGRPTRHLLSTNPGLQGFVACHGISTVLLLLSLLVNIKVGIARLVQMSILPRHGPCSGGFTEQVPLYRITLQIV